MTLLDANILLYAYHAGAPEHAACRRWLEEALGGWQPLLLPWTTILAFLRISTNPRIFRTPLTMAEAAAAVESWLGQPVVRLLQPTERHWETLSALLAGSQISGHFVTDADLAALALEHGATLCTTDRDFSRFPGLKLLNPLAV